jgi:hypothetical protein
VADPVEDGTEEAFPRGPRPFGLGGKELPEVRPARRRQKRVAQGVGNDVAVRVAHEALGMVDRQGPEHQRDPWREAVGIKPETDAQAHPNSTCAGSRRRKRVIVV